MIKKTNRISCDKCGKWTRPRFVLINKKEFILCGKCLMKLKNMKGVKYEKKIQNE